MAVRSLVRKFKPTDPLILDFRSSLDNDFYRVYIGLVNSQHVMIYLAQHGRRLKGVDILLGPQVFIASMMSRHTNTDEFPFVKRQGV